MADNVLDRFEAPRNPHDEFATAPTLCHSCIEDATCSRLDFNSLDLDLDGSHLNSTSVMTCVRNAIRLISWSATNPDLYW